MPELSLGVTLAVLGAALAHATWNAMLKSSREVLFDMALVVLFAGLATAPFLPFVEVPAPAVWPYIAASMTIHIAYYVALVGAYRAGALSHGYPLMRGLAPLIVSLCALAWLGEAPKPLVWVGVLLICGGVLSLGLAGFSWRGSRTATTWALANAVIIAAYTLVDRQGVRHAAPVPYLWLVLVMPAVVYAGWMARSRGSPPAACAGWSWPATAGPSAPGQTCPGCAPL